MIAKTKHNASASATINYNLQTEKAYKLLHHSDNLRVPTDSADVKGKQAMIADFNYQVSERHKHPIGHTVINFGADKGWERMDTLTKEKFCSDVIASKGLKDTQYFFVEHNDTPYKHLHLVYNKTDNFGKGIHQDKHAIDDNLLTYKLGHKYGLEIPPRTKSFIDRQLKQDPDYIKKVEKRPLGNQLKPQAISEDKLTSHQKNDLLKRARNEHHLSKLAMAQGVNFNRDDTQISLNNNSYDRKELAAVFAHNRLEFAEQKLAMKQANKEKEIKESKPDYLQKIELRQALELKRQRELELALKRELALKKELLLEKTRKKSLGFDLPSM